MAESKKPSSGKKSAHETRNEAAEALRQAAELIASLNSEAQAETTTKKPAAKKPAAKKPAAKSGTAKAPAKKPTTKKPATKAAPKDEAVEQPAEPQKKFGNRRSDCQNCGAENDKYALVCHVCGAQLPPLPEGMVPPTPVEEKPVVQEQPVVEEQPAVEEKPVVEEKPAEEKPVEEKPAEQPVAAAEQPAVEQKPAPAQPAKKSNGFLDKVSNFINNKGKLPLWIVANVLLLLSSIFLLAGAFSIPVAKSDPITGNVFTYYGNSAAIKAYWQGTAGQWAGGGYAMMGILMFFSFIGPLALIAKNVVLFVLKKNKEVHMLDAIITFTFLVAYLGVVGMYGANVTWAHVLSLIMSIILLAYTIFVILLENRSGMFPFFSIANLVMILLCIFLLTNTKIYNAAGCYAAFVAALDGGAGFAFIMLLIALAALVLLIVMQVKKLPGKIAWLFEFLVPAVAGVFSFIALVTFAGLTPKGVSMGGGFVFGAILTLLLAIADVVFALVPQLHKFNVKVADKAGKTPTTNAQPATAPVVQPAPAEQPAPAASAQPEQPAAAEQPAQPEQPAAAPADKLKCPACGMENGANDVFCMKCGRKLK
ncbi:MAG: zinc-ribbon domain-containing protein [Clostridiales bacterium]|nr:zinc-ribbon domain-containing protein [Clostridiales bacterium]